MLIFIGIIVNITHLWLFLYNSKPKDAFNSLSKLKILLLI